MLQKNNKSVAFKNNAPFISCISKINGIKNDNAVDLDVYLNTVKIIEKQQQVRDEPSYTLSSDSGSFKYKTSVRGNTYNVDEKITDDDGNEADNPKYDANKVGENEAEVVILLKHLSNFWRSLIFH